MHSFKSQVVRYALPDTRRGKTVKFQIMAVNDETKEVDMVEGYLTVSVYANGVPGEVFLTLGKEGHEQHGWADSWARQFSVLLQTGIDLKYLYSMSKGQSFAPQGVTNLPQVPLCKSIPDLIVRWMEATFPPTKAGSDIDAKYDNLLDNILESE